jgi:sensor histidine kinase regulating citrate/malate metabolism
MQGNFRILLLVLTLIVIVSVITGITITTLYNAAFEKEAERLTETARSWARIIESVARYDQQNSIRNFAGAKNSRCWRLMTETVFPRESISATQNRWAWNW